MTKFMRNVNLHGIEPIVNLVVRMCALVAALD
jgi:hypothetical protein